MKVKYQVQDTNTFQKSIALNTSVTLPLYTSETVAKTIWFRAQPGCHRFENYQRESR